MDFQALLASLLQEPASAGAPVTPPAQPGSTPRKKSMRKTLNVPASQLPVFEEPKDFRASMHWRVFRIMAELMDGWQFLADFPNSVAVFGSAEIPEDHHWYQEAMKLGTLITNSGISAVTEGGPGIMEAVNRGALEAIDMHKGESLGLTIKLPHHTRMNPYVEKSVSFHYFFVRSLMMSFCAKAYVYFPGGLGTLDHLTAILTLEQTQKVAAHVPIILIGREFWQPALEWINKTMLEQYRTIDAADTGLYTVVDNARDAFEIIKVSPDRKEFFLRD